MHDIAIKAVLRELFGLLATAKHPGMKGQTTRRLGKPRQTARQIRIVILHSAVSDEAAFAGVDGADGDVAYPLDVLRSGRAVQGAGCEGSDGEICVAPGIGT